MTKTFKWTDESTTALLNAVNGESPVSVDTLNATAEQLGTTVRSVAAKLRKLGHLVASTAKAREPKFSPEDTDALKTFLVANSGQYTYAEVASKLLGGKYDAKTIQGKVLSLDMTGTVKKTEKVVVPRTYSPEQEARFLEMAKAGATVEEIATSLGKSIPAVRGKALSFFRQKELAAVPKQATKVDHIDPIEEILAKLPTMTVAQIAEATEKSERGVKTILTRRGLAAADYDGAAKRAKKDAAAEAAV